MPKRIEREYRDMQILVQTDETVVTEFNAGGERVEQPLDPLSSFRVDGYATTWEPYTLFEDEQGAILEQFTPDSFRNTDMSDVILQYDHSGRVFARQSNGSLVLKIDDHGLAISADLSRTDSAKELFQEIKAGMITKMSWGFIPGEYHYDKKTRTIVHDSVKKVFDVSVVSIPANPGTEINARGLVTGEVTKVLEEFKRAERTRKQLELKLKLAQF